MERKHYRVLLLAAIFGTVVSSSKPVYSSLHSTSKEESVAEIPALEGVLHRSPRQVNPNREQVIGNIFQVPIATLTAVSSLLQSTRPIQERPLFQNLMNHHQQQQQQSVQQSQPLQYLLQNHPYFQDTTSTPPTFLNGLKKIQRTAGAKAAQVKIAKDGSSFKI